MRILPAFSVVVMLLPAAASRADISGTVVDADTGTPMAGARVTLQATDVETTTGADGAFRLPCDDGTRIKVVAGHVGYFHAGADAQAPASGVELRMEAVPAGDNPDYAFLRPATCAQCHVRQAPGWQASAMAHAGRNRWVYDLYDGTGTDGGAAGFVYVRDSVHAAHNPASECRSCHQPVPWLKEPFTALSPIDQPSSDVDIGVACDVCHKIARIDETRTGYPGLWPGVVEVTRPGPGWNVEYGALGDVTFRLDGTMRPSWQPQLPAAICAACHQDNNDPDEDGDFQEDGGVTSEPTYLEWKQSPYGDPASALHATCADCHMAPLPDRQACGVLGPVIFRPLGDVTDHRMEGTTPAYLERAVSLSLEARAVEDRLLVTATLVNDRTGHRVPTGVTMRNMILVVEAWRTPDGRALELLQGPRVHDLAGVGNPADGDYAGLPGRLYAKVAHDAQGRGPAFFTEATGILEDNRLEPLQADVTAYAFSVPPGGGNLHVRARVIYRRAWRSLVLRKGWTRDGHDGPLEDVAPPHFGHLMASAERLVSVLPSCDAGTCPPCRADPDCGEGWRCVAAACTASTAVDAGAPGDAGASSSSSAPSSSVEGPPPSRAGCRHASPGGGLPWWSAGPWLVAYRLASRRRKP